MLKAGYNDSCSTVDARSIAVWPFPPYCSTGFGADGCQRNMSVLSLQNNSILTWNPSTQLPARFNRWPSYRVMTTYNIPGIRLLHKMCGQLWQVADLQGWPTLQVLQYNCGHASACLPIHFCINIMLLQSSPSYAFYFPVITNTNTVAVNFWGAYETSACECEGMKIKQVLWRTFLQNVKQQRDGINSTFTFPGDGDYRRTTETTHFECG